MRRREKSTTDRSYRGRALQLRRTCRPRSNQSRKGSRRPKCLCPTRWDERNSLVSRACRHPLRRAPAQGIGTGGRCWQTVDTRSETSRWNAQSAEPRRANPAASVSVNPVCADRSHQMRESFPVRRVLGTSPKVPYFQSVTETGRARPSHNNARLSRLGFADREFVLPLARTEYPGQPERMRRPCQKLKPVALCISSRIPCLADQGVRPVGGIRS